MSERSLGTLILDLSLPESILLPLCHLDIEHYSVYVCMRVCVCVGGGLKDVSQLKITIIKK